MKKTKILLVEDEVIVAEDLKINLKKLGYLILASVTTGEEAIEIAQKYVPDVILMDIKLASETDGIETANAINKSCKIPIIFLTAHADRSTLKRVRNIRHYGYILKPFGDRELTNSIEMALYIHRLENKVTEDKQIINTILKNISDAIITTDEAGKVKIMNPLAESITGWRLNDAINKPIIEIFKLDDRNYTNLSENQQEFNFIDFSNLSTGNDLLITKSGTKVPIKNNIITLEDKIGNVIGVNVIFNKV